MASTMGSITASVITPYHPSDGSVGTDDGPVVSTITDDDDDENDDNDEDEDDDNDDAAIGELYAPPPSTPASILSFSFPIYRRESPITMVAKMQINSNTFRPTRKASNQEEPPRREEEGL